MSDSQLRAGQRETSTDLQERCTHILRRIQSGESIMDDLSTICAHIGDPVVDELFRATGIDEPLEEILPGRRTSIQSEPITHLPSITLALYAQTINYSRNLGQSIIAKNYVLVRRNAPWHSPSVWMFPSTTSAEHIHETIKDTPTHQDPRGYLIKLDTPGPGSGKLHASDHPELFKNISKESVWFELDPDETMELGRLQLSAAKDSFVGFLRTYEIIRYYQIKEEFRDILE